jgi:molybdopterin/thiamine biosynthesis adenylyltransferase
MIDRERYSRLLAIPDYPAEKVVHSLVVVGGVGALGNELVKNLCLLGFRYIFMADLDTVEPSNLTRSVLFRPADCGKSKVEAAAVRGKEINSETNFYAHNGDVAAIGLGVFRRASLIFSDFDDLYPRYVINSIGAKLGKVWIDAYLGLKPYGGGVIVIDGSSESAPCYVCHTGYRTYKETFNYIQDREGCQVKERNRSEQGFLPTTPTTCSVIAGLQAQAGLHYLVNGTSSDNPWISKMYHIDLAGLKSHLEIPVKRRDCPFHPPSDHVTADRLLEFHSWKADTTTMKDVFDDVRTAFNFPRSSTLYIQLNRQLVMLERCVGCGSEVEVFRPVIELVRAKRKGLIRICPKCGSAELIFHPLYGVTSLLEEGMSFQNYSLKSLGISPLDILTILEDTGEEQNFFFAELTGDLEQLLPGFSEQEK